MTENIVELIAAGQAFRGESDQYAELITELADELQLRIAVLYQVSRLAQPVEALTHIEDDDLSDSSYAERKFAEHLRAVLAVDPPNVLADIKAQARMDGIREAINFIAQDPEWDRCIIHAREHFGIEQEAQS